MGGMEIVFNYELVNKIRSKSKILRRVDTKIHNDMTQEEIKSFSKKVRRKFKNKHLREIENWLVDAGDTEIQKIKKSIKSPIKMNSYAFFLGIFAMDRFALRQPFLAFLKIIWCWGLIALSFVTGIFYIGIPAGLWLFIDWCTAPFRTYNYNYKVVKKILNKE